MQARDAMLHCSLARADAWESSISAMASSSLLAGRCHSAAVWAAMKDCSPVAAPRNSKLRRRWLSPVWEVGNQLGRRETTGGDGLALVKIELEAKSAALLLGGEGCCTLPDPLPCGWQPHVLRAAVFSMPPDPKCHCTQPPADELDPLGFALFRRLKMELFVGERTPLQPHLPAGWPGRWRSQRQQEPPQMQAGRRQQGGAQQRCW